MMSARTGAMACCLTVGLLAWGVCGTAATQDIPGNAEVVPAPAPSPTTPPAEAPSTPRPDPRYDPIKAGRDAYRMAEEQRRWAINRQLWLMDEIRWYNTWYPYVDRYALPYIYTYAPPRVARRVHRELRRGAGDWGFTPWPRVPGDIYGYPYYPWIRQPIGHEKIRTGPNSYIYRPVYEKPTAKQPPPAAVPTPAPAAGQTRPQQPPAVSPDIPPRQPALTPPKRPAPPIEPGPREF